MRYLLAALLALSAGTPAAPPPGRIVVALVPYFTPGTPAPDSAVGALAVPAGHRIERDLFTSATREVVVADERGAESFEQAVERARRADPAVLVLVGEPRPGHLGAVAITGAPGLLRGSTRRAGLVSLDDLVSYVRDGTPIATVPGTAGNVAELDRIEHLRHRYNGVDVNVVGGIGILLWLYVLRRRRLPRRIALLVAALPVAGFAASAAEWWNAPAPAVAATGAIAVATLLIGGLAGALGVAAICAALLFADLLAGGHLEQTGISSYSALVGGRFYGIGNVGFAILATAAVVVLGAAARRYGTRAWLGLLPVIAVDGLAMWGADFGGAIALTAAFVAAVTSRARRATVVLGSLAGVVVAAGAALLDYAQPPARQTHLGRFVGEVLHGGWTGTVTRKMHHALHSMTGTWYPLYVAAAVVAGVYVLRRLNDRGLDPTVRALAVLWVVGSLVNDSGLVVAGTGMAVAVPLLVAHAAERA